jgi:hypothetical protein
VDAIVNAAAAALPGAAAIAVNLCFHSETVRAICQRALNAA